MLIFCFWGLHGILKTSQGSRSYYIDILKCCKWNVRRSTFTIGFCFFRNYDCLPNLLDPILTWTRCYQWPIPFKYANTYQDSKQLHEHNQSFMVEPWPIVVLLVQGWDSKTDCMPWMSGAETDIHWGDSCCCCCCCRHEAPINVLPLLLNSFEKVKGLRTFWLNGVAHDFPLES